MSESRKRRLSAKAATIAKRKRHSSHSTSQPYLVDSPDTSSQFTDSVPYISVRTKLDELENYSSIAFDAIYDEEFTQKFFSKFGKQIKYLELWNNSEIEVEFDITLLNNCSQLETLEFVNSWEIKTFSHPSTPNNIFKQITSLSLTVHSDYQPIEAEVLVQFGEFLQAFAKLNTLRIQCEDVSVQREVLPYIIFRLPLIPRYQQVLEEYIRNPPSRPYPLTDVASLIQNCDEIEYDLASIGEIQCSIDTVQDELLSRISCLHYVNTPRGDNNHFVPFTKLNNIRDLKLVHFRVSESQKNEGAMVFQNLRKLELWVDSSGSQKYLIYAMHLFGVEDNNVEDLNLNLPKIDENKKRENIEIHVMEFLQKFKKLSDLTLVNQFFPTWLPCLQNVTQLEIERVALTEKDFIGSGSIHHPQFTQLFNLSHLTLTHTSSRDAGKWIESIFQYTFSQMKLKTLDIMDSDFPVTKKALDHLKNSPFANTIEYFPYPLFSQEDFQREFSEREFQRFQMDNFKSIQRS